MKTVTPIAPATNPNTTRRPIGQACETVWGGADIPKLGMQITREGTANLAAKKNKEDAR
jgi:hypothetical protein